MGRSPRREDDESLGSEGRLQHMLFGPLPSSLVSALAGLLALTLAGPGEEPVVAPEDRGRAPRCCAASPPGARAATHAEARDIVSRAFPGEFRLDPYRGDNEDLAYLRRWVLEHVTRYYDVPAGAFDCPTVGSTSILRDFVHRALYQTTKLPQIGQVTLEYPQNSDVATAFRYPATGLCGLLAWQAYQVYRAFGYAATNLATVAGELGAATHDGHVFSEVYVEDLGNFIMQDATFNFLMRDSSGRPLSFHEARDEIHRRRSQLTFDGFENRRSWSLSSQPDIFQRDFFRLLYWWYGPDGSMQGAVYKLFPDPRTAHDPSSDQGAAFATRGEALAAIRSRAATGQGWREVARQLRREHYVSGFALGEGARPDAHWLTVRLQGGGYLSVNLETGAALDGSFDQLSIDATSRSPTRNPGADLTAFLQPALLLDWRGEVGRLAPDDIPRCRPEPTADAR